MKEIEINHQSILNLDDIVYKTKNFASIFWGGALYLIIENQSTFKSSSQLIFLSSLIPMVFWIIHCIWQNQLINTSKRGKLISDQINSPNFENWLEGVENKFYLFDPINKWNNNKNQVRSNILKVMFYKDGFYYPLMILISIILGFFITNTSC